MTSAVVKDQPQKARTAVKKAENHPQQVVISVGNRSTVGATTVESITENHPQVE